MTTAATLGNVYTGQNSNDGTGLTIKDAFDLVNVNTYKLNLQLNSDAAHSNEFPATYITVTDDIYANTGTIWGETIRGGEIFVNGSPVLTSTTGGWNGGTIPYYGIFANTDPSYSTTTGVVTVAGGVGIAGNLNLGGLLNVSNTATFTDISTNNLATGNINATGNTVLNSLFTINSNYFNGTSTFLGAANFNGSMTINTPLAMNNNLTVTGIVFSDGDFYANAVSRLSNAQINTLTARGFQAEAIGNIIPGTGSFTTLGASGVTSFTNTTQSTSASTGAVVVSGGMGIAKDLYVGGTVFATNLAAVTSQTLVVQDPLVNLISDSGSYNYDIGVYSNYTGAYGVKYTGLIRNYSDNVWKLFSNVSAPAGSTVSLTNAVYDQFKAGNIITTGTFQGSGAGLTSIPNSSLSNSSITVTAGTGMSGGGAVSLGGSITLTNAGVTGLTAGTGVSLSGSTGSVTVGIGQAVATSSTPTFAGITVPSITHSGTSGTGDIGSSTNLFGTIYGTASTAKYADLAENYKADLQYEPGTVLEFGGTKEVTIAQDGTRKVAGVVSTDPAYLMNSCCESEFVVAIALQGRVPCKVRGKIEKGDMLVSAGSGFARAEYSPVIGSVIGKALEDFNGIEGVIEVVVGRL